MIKKLTNKKIVLISATVMVVVLILGFTLALWSNNFTQSGTNTIASDCFNIEYSESDATSLVNAYPQTDEDGLKNVSYDVTIENTCDTIATYNVILNELSTNTLAESHVKVAVNGNYKMLNTYEEATPSSEVENASSARLLTLGVLAPQQEKTIGIKSWMDEATTEAEGENKTFSYKITIDTAAGTNGLLAAEVLNSIPLHSEIPNQKAFTYGEPASAGATSVTYDEYTDTYTDTLGGNKTVGKGYNFDSATGYYNLTDYEENVSFGENYIGYYTCNSYIHSNCTIMYKIEEVSGTSVRKSTRYYAAGSISGSGIFKTLDNDGESYYLRGNIANDHVDFAGKKWRIVRINGDGTIRLILNSSVGNSAFNPSEDKKYGGYTYDNSKICTASSPCNGNEGTSSTIKTYLDNWYATNLANYDSQIATTTYCNDTSHTGDYNYGAYKRTLFSHAPSLICPDTTENYGGLYKLKIGLISADEMSMIGFNMVWNGTGSPLKYLYSTSFWSLSPRWVSSNHTSVLNFVRGSISNVYVRSSAGVVPVINLASDAKITSGNGTKTSPYVIDLN